MHLMLGLQASKAKCLSISEAIISQIINTHFLTQSIFVLLNMQDCLETHLC